MVEDDEDNLFFATAILELSHYQFLASNGRTGIDIAMDKLPDLILLDIVMPEVNGVEVIKTLRRNPLTNHIYIIATTGLTHPKDVQIIMDAGCDEYLHKPFSIEQLEQKLKHFLTVS